MQKYNNTYYEAPSEVEHSPSNTPAANSLNATSNHQVIKTKPLKLIQNFRNANTTTSKPKVKTSFQQQRPQVQTTPATKTPFLHIRLPQNSNSIYERNRDPFYDESVENEILASINRKLDFSSIVNNLFLDMDNYY